MSHLLLCVSYTHSLHKSLRSAQSSSEQARSHLRQPYTIFVIDMHPRSTIMTQPSTVALTAGYTTQYTQARQQAEASYRESEGYVSFPDFDSYYLSTGRRRAQSSARCNFTSSWPHLDFHLRDWIRSQKSNFRDVYENVKESWSCARRQSRAARKEEKLMTAQGRRVAYLSCFGVDDEALDAE